MGETAVNAENSLRAHVPLEVSRKQVCLGVAHVSTALFSHFLVR